jgi:HEAT repeats
MLTKDVISDLLSEDHEQLYRRSCETTNPSERLHIRDILFEEDLDWLIRRDIDEFFAAFAIGFTKAMDETTFLSFDEAVQEIIALLNTPDSLPDDPIALSYRLCAIVTRYADTIGCLLGQFEERDDLCRNYIGMALLGTWNSMVISRFASMVAEDADGDLSHDISRLCSRSRFAFDELVKATGDSSETVREGAAILLGMQAADCHEEAVARLIKALDDVKSNVRDAAVFALTEIGVAAELALPALRKLQRRLGVEMQKWSPSQSPEGMTAIKAARHDVIEAIKRIGGGVTAQSA